MSDDSTLNAAEAKARLESMFSGLKTQPAAAPRPGASEDPDKLLTPEEAAKRKASKAAQKSEVGASFKVPKAFAPKRQIFSRPKKSTGRAPTEYRMRLEQLRSMRDKDMLIKSIDNFLKHHQLPDEADILYKVLQHPKESVCREALGQLSSLLMQGRLTSTGLLKNHLDELRKRCTEDATLSFVNGMEAQLASL